MKKPTIDEWFAIQREKARRIGYIGGVEELCDRYESLEREQFGGLCNHEREITLGMFGRYDDVVDCSEEFKQHYPHVCYYEGGHRLSEEVIKELLVTKIEEFRAQMLD